MGKPAGVSYAINCYAVSGKEGSTVNLKGLKNKMSAFLLKMIALVFMFLDHVAEFIPDTPIVFRWMGRISAPVFIYCCVWSFEYTSSKIGYMKRLYFAGVLMSIVQYFLNIQNNFFRILFSIVVILYIVEPNNKKNRKKNITIWLLWQTASILLVALLVLSSTNARSEKIFTYVLPAVCGNLFYLEGSIFYILLGVLFWIHRNSRKGLALSFATADALYFFINDTSILTRVMGKMQLLFRNAYYIYDFLEYVLNTVIGLPLIDIGGSVLYDNYEWMMIIALPLLLSYNHKRGYPVKRFFYAFYIIHIVVLYYVGKYIC